MITSVSLVNAFARAIAAKEGFFDTGRSRTIPQRLNNPGDLRRWKKADGEPYPEVNGFADFPKCGLSHCKNPDHPAETGWRALRAQVKINVFKRGLTFHEFFAGKRGVYDGYAPAKDKNNPDEYARFVLDKTCRSLAIAIVVGPDNVARPNVFTMISSLAT